MNIPEKSNQHLSGQSLRKREQSQEPFGKKSKFVPRLVGLPCNGMLINWTEVDESCKDLQGFDANSCSRLYSWVLTLHDCLLCHAMLCFDCNLSVGSQFHNLTCSREVTSQDNFARN